jgi:nucleotide-binding universal stress UspA family protein
MPATSNAAQHDGFRRIVVCVDSSEASHCVAEFVRRLAGPLTEITIASVAPDPQRLIAHTALSGVDVEVAHKKLLEDAERAIDSLQNLLVDGTAAVRTQVIDLARETGDAAQTLSRIAAGEAGVDMMIFGIRQYHGLVSWFDPTVTDELSKLAACAMVVVPAGYASPRDTGLQRVLFAVDGSPASLAAVRIGAMLALPDTQMRLVYVVDCAMHHHGLVPATLLEDAFVKEGNEAITDALRQLQSLHGVTRPLISTELIRTKASADDVPGALLREAENWNADLMVMGMHGRRGIVRTYLGSVPHRVASLTTIPLIEVCDRRGEKSPHVG